MNHFLPLLLLFTCLSFSKGNYQKTELPGDDLKINQLQVIASHNSYHMRTDRSILRFLTNLYKLHVIPKELNPEGIDYTNVPLTEQLEKYHVRGLELDVWNDPKGGHFYRRMGRAYELRCSASHIAELKQPGFKLLHIPDFDYISTNVTFKDALAEIKAWSDAHPNHLPVFINVETETSAPGDQVHQLHHLTKAVPLDTVAGNNLDQEVRSIFGENLAGVITPDKVRGNYATLEEAVLAGKWPTVADARGKVIFIIDGDSRFYRSGRPSFKGRAMFGYSNPGTPEAAFVIHNGAKNEFADIQKHVKQGYIIRTRSDEGTVQARTGDTTERTAALISWAQIISTDYYRPDARAGKKGWTNYKVELPNGVIARVDSISAPNQLGHAIKE